MYKHVHIYVYVHVYDISVILTLHFKIDDIYEVSHPTPANDSNRQRNTCPMPASGSIRESNPGSAQTSESIREIYHEPPVMSPSQVGPYWYV